MGESLYLLIVAGVGIIALLAVVIAYFVCRTPAEKDSEQNADQEMDNICVI